MSLLGVLAASLVAAAAPAGASDRCGANLASSLASTRGAQQLVTVEAASYASTGATLRTWRRVGACWKPVAGPWSAWVGREGLSDNRSEGDGTTPTGAYRIGSTMYGTESDPGVAFGYRRLVCGDWWSEDSASPTYNSFQHVPCGKRPPFTVKSEGLWQQPLAYRHFAVIEFNMHPVSPGRGSGIFLHVARGHPTNGCVSLPLGRLLRVLRWLQPADAPLVVIGTRATIRRY